MRGIFDGGFSNTDGNAEEEYEAANGDWGEELDMVDVDGIQMETFLQFWMTESRVKRMMEKADGSWKTWSFLLQLKLQKLLPVLDLQFSWPQHLGCELARCGFRNHLLQLIMLLLAILIQQ
ncbi:hypothetical protein HN51_043823 [Arachis hypogaea]